MNDETRINIKALKAFIIENAITDATLIPTTLNNMDLNGFLSHTQLKSIYSTGEACTAAIVTACETNHIVLWNCYGPTEATFGISIMPCLQETLHLQYGAPIGDPDPGVKVHLLDEDGRLTQCERVGQLYIESPYMTPGYWKRPAETAKRFVYQSLFGSSQAVRLYATGDRFLRDSQGMLRYCGRCDIDDQIKICGVLVNVHEVEAQLKLINGIDDACVLFIEKEAQGMLVGFVKTSHIQLTNNAIKNTLNTVLPAVSIPKRLIRIAEFPQTANGKLDKAQLIERFHQTANSTFFGSMRLAVVNLP